MKTERIDPRKNYQSTLKEIGFIPLREATAEDWRRIGFMSGLEVHQQLDTERKLFCRCPAGIYHDNDDYNAEIIRHMRPTLSELGEYDGTALMEFKTKKNIIYRINNETACTYEIDDTPPFRIDSQALKYAIEISLLCNLNIVGEVHITRKQYLDGSIPTGFQRTAILGVEGEIQLSNKKVRLIQLSLEEDSCREISDEGHWRVYKTDRLGMPLIETVTYPDLETPWELKEAAERIRFLNRSSGRVRVGSGAGREDVNVSCAGGTRVEIKGVSYNRNIPILSHNEAFRQYALLHIRELLNKRVGDPGKWQMTTLDLDIRQNGLGNDLIRNAFKADKRVVLVNLPGYAGILSHFVQPGMGFQSELEQRVKVIACIDQPNMLSSEDLNNPLPDDDLKRICKLLGSGADDAQLVVFGPAGDIQTALETIEERCRMAFEGVPNETRKSLLDGGTVFERVLPGADRMYPDTDSAPIPLEDEFIDKLRENLPVRIEQRYAQFDKWNVPEDARSYILRNNLVPIIERCAGELNIPPRYTATFFAHRLKYIEGHYIRHKDFDYEKVYSLFRYLAEKELELNLAEEMLPILYEHPNMNFKSILTSINFKERKPEELYAPVSYLVDQFREIRRTKRPEAVVDWVMGQLRNHAVGNIDLAELRRNIEKVVSERDNG